MHNFLYYESLILNNCFIFFSGVRSSREITHCSQQRRLPIRKKPRKVCKVPEEKGKKKTIKEFEETFICDCPNVLNPVDLTLTSPPLYFYYGYHYLQETDNEIQQVSKIDRWITFDILELIFKVIRN